MGDNMPIPKPCEMCKGSGKVTGTICYLCNGLGEVYMDRIKISNHYEKFGGN